MGCGFTKNKRAPSVAPIPKQPSQDPIAPSSSPQHQDPIVSAPAPQHQDPPAEIPQPQIPDPNPVPIAASEPEQSPTSSPPAIPSHPLVPEKEIEKEKEKETDTSSSPAVPVKQDSAAATDLKPESPSDHVAPEPLNQSDAQPSNQPPSPKQQPPTEPAEHSVSSAAAQSNPEPEKQTEPPAMAPETQPILAKEPEQPKQVSPRPPVASSSKSDLQSVKMKLPPIQPAASHKTKYGNEINIDELESRGKQLAEQQIATLRSQDPASAKHPPQQPAPAPAPAPPTEVPFSPIKKPLKGSDTSMGQLPPIKKPPVILSAETLDDLERKGAMLAAQYKKDMNAST